MEAAPSAMPPNPKMAAIIAITKKVAAQRNIIFKGLRFRELNCRSDTNLRAKKGTFVLLVQVNYVEVSM